MNLERRRIKGIISRFASGAHLRAKSTGTGGSFTSVISELTSYHSDPNGAVSMDNHEFPPEADRRCGWAVRAITDGGNAQFRNWDARLSAMKKGVRWGDDRFAYATGTWLKTVGPPSNPTGVGTFADLAAIG